MRVVVFVLLTLLLSVAVCRGQAAVSTDSLHIESPFSADYVKLVGRDIAHIGTAPFHWKERQWEFFASRTAAVVGAYAVLDYEARSFFRRNQSQFGDDLAKRVEPFGRTYPVAIEAGFYLGGVIFKKPNARATALDAVSADLISTELVSPLLKLAVGRERPYFNQGNAKFEPFSGNESFPSGHTTHAFMLASVIDSHYKQTWVKIAAYGIASLVACQRMYVDVHWSSDVLAGALLGYSVGKGVVAFNKLFRERSAQQRRN